MQRRHHWWNGERGGSTRHDISIYENTTTWTVESRKGDPVGSTRWWSVPDEDTATLIAYYLMTDAGKWRDLPE